MLTMKQIIKGHKFIEKSKHTADYRKFISTYVLPDNAVKIHKHHIVPTSFGGTNHKENLIHLTIEDHVYAHELLLQACRLKGKQAYTKKMQFAYSMLNSKHAKLPEPFKKYLDTYGSFTVIAEGRILRITPDNQEDVARMFLHMNKRKKTGTSSHDIK